MGSDAAQSFASHIVYKDFAIDTTDTKRLVEEVARYHSRGEINAFRNAYAIYLMGEAKCQSSNH